MERDEELETAIDAAGREAVFMRAQSYGWSGVDVPPKWVWWGIVKEIQDGTPPPYQPQTGVSIANLFGL